MSIVPARTPCGSCPYRRDVPSGVWSQEEYEKLPPYDNETAEQPFAAFFCHQQDGRLCAGWVGCHDMENSLGLRMVAAMTPLDLEEFNAIVDYTTPVPLFESGAAAAAHGMAGIEEPGEKAEKVIAKLSRRRKRLTASEETETI